MPVDALRRATYERFRAGASREGQAERGKAENPLATPLPPPHSHLVEVTSGRREPPHGTSVR